MTPLDRYHEKRDFAKTPEPAGAADAQPHDRSSFVIQKHAASRLHYDFRLEIDGVLASWAVPKGPSLDPHDKRLAMHVEDHPLEYGSFEGTIPAGEYGGGTVMLWDHGTYEPELDMTQGLAKGELKFTLHGGKLQGSWALVRMKPRPGEKSESWLLIKHRDEHARLHEEYDVLAVRTESITTGRSMDEITAAGLPDAPAHQVGSAVATLAQGTAPLPADTPMQLATVVAEAPSGPEWIHEIKYDGYRARIALADGHARVLTRTGADWTDRFAAIARAAEALPISSALIDGEIVALGADGISDFGRLQRALSEGAGQKLTYMAFDLLHLNGHDLREQPLLARKELLAALLEGEPAGAPLRYTDHVVADGHAFHHEACAMRLEGAVSKRGDRPYVPGRGGDWLKTKCLERQEFVVVGWSDPAGSRRGFGALLLGVYENGSLRYAGRVGTGFTEADLEAISQRLAEIASKEAPLEVPAAVAKLGPHWVRPELVAEVAFREWTRDGVVRQPSFKGLRDDKPADEVVNESSPPPPDDPPTAGKANAEVAGIRITNPDKVLYPPGGTREAGVTKLELARYYEAVWPHIAPHIVGRPLTLVRCPHGSARTCFYQKHPDARGSAPAALRTVQILEHAEEQTYFWVEDLPGIEALVQLGVLEIHAWNSLAADPEHPDRIVFDLDPAPDVEWPAVRSAAVLIRDSLAALELNSYVKTTGGKGLHVIVPIEPDLDYGEVRAFAHAFVERIEAADPDHFTARMALDRRPGRVFIDYLRNAHGATAVVAFSTRARDGAPVSVPCSWEELSGADALPLMGIEETVARVRATGYTDPWDGYGAASRPLTDAMFTALGIPRQGRLGDAD